MNSEEEDNKKRKLLDKASTGPPLEQNDPMGVEAVSTGGGVQPLPMPPLPVQPLPTHLRLREELYMSYLASMIHRSWQIR